MKAHERLQTGIPAMLCFRLLLTLSPHAWPNSPLANAAGLANWLQNPLTASDCTRLGDAFPNLLHNGRRGLIRRAAFKGRIGIIFDPQLQSLRDQTSGKAIDQHQCQIDPSRNARSGHDLTAFHHARIDRLGLERSHSSAACWLRSGRLLVGFPIWSLTSMPIWRATLLCHGSLPSRECHSEPCIAGL